jgi:hypothetical protein
MTIRPVLISLSDIRTGLAQTLHAYWNQHGFIQPVCLTRQGNQTVYISAVNGRPVTDALIESLMYELIAEYQTDMRNADPLHRTEAILVHHSVDERTAHEIVENLFANVVNTLGEHLPELTFNNHTDFQFRLSGPDLLIWKP